MKIRTSGWIPVLDLSAPLSLLAPYHAEWRHLRFDSDGWVVNPVTGERGTGLRLVAGRHRRRSAQYLVVDETPIIGLPAHLVAARDAELADLRQRPMWPSDVAAVEQRYAGLEEQIGVDRTEVTLRVLRDTDTDVRLRWTQDGVWTATTAIDLSGPPKVSATFDSDVAALSADTDELGGCAAWFFRGPVRVKGVVDTSALDAPTPTRFVTAKGRVSRFPFSGHVDVCRWQDRWQLDVVLDVRARGVGRLALLVLGRFARSRIDAALDRWWAEGAPHIWKDIEGEVMSQFERLIEHYGPAEFVRLSLWDSDVLDEALEHPDDGGEPAGS